MSVLREYKLVVRRAGGRSSEHEGWHDRSSAECYGRAIALGDPTVAWVELWRRDAGGEWLRLVAA